MEVVLEDFVGLLGSLQLLLQLVDGLLVFDVLRLESIEFLFVVLVLAIPVLVLVPLRLQLLLFFFERGSLGYGAFQLSFRLQQFFLDLFHGIFMLFLLLESFVLDGFNFLIVPQL